MNYFDDIRFLHVAETVSSVSSFDSITQEWGCGIMTGNGFVRKCTSSGEGILLKMPFLYLVRPGDHTGWQAVQGAARHNRWFVMDGPRAERIGTALASAMQNNFILNLPSYQELILIHQRMKHLYQCAVPARRYQLALYAEEFVGSIYDLLTMKEKKLPVFEFIAQTAERISLHPEEHYDFYSMAEKNHVTYDYFRHCFKEYAGESMREFLTRKRLERALDLLRTSSDSIKEITERCGFPRQAEFARFIKSQTGLTPSEIRKHRQTVWDH